MLPDGAARAQQPPREMGDIPLNRRTTAGLTLAEVQLELAKSDLRATWLIEEKKKIDLEKSKLEESISSYQPPIDACAEVRIKMPSLSHFLSSYNY